MAESGFDSMAAFAMGMDSGKCANGNNNGNGGYGGMNDWMGLAMFALIFGRNGNGLFGNNGNDGGGWGNRGPWATQEDVRAAVDQQTLISKLDQQTYGLADTFTALNNNLNSNFRGIDNAICTLGFQSQQGFGNLSAQLAACCCDIERGIERNTTQGVMNTNAIQSQIAACCCDLEKANMQNRFDAQTYNCNTLQAIDKLGDRIIDYMTNEKIDSLRAENQALRFSASQDRQNAYITTAMQAQTNQLIDRIAPYPVPSFNVCAPYQFGGYGAYGHNGFGGGFGFGRDGRDGCGCGSCC